MDKKLILLDFNNMTMVIFVGEETGGKPNHFGYIKYLKLPSSGLTVSYSTKYFKRTNKELKTITPDYINETGLKTLKKDMILFITG